MGGVTADKVLACGFLRPCSACLRFLEGAADIDACWGADSRQASKAVASPWCLGRSWFLAGRRNCGVMRKFTVLSTAADNESNLPLCCTGRLLCHSRRTCSLVSKYERTPRTVEHNQITDLQSPGVQQWQSTWSWAFVKRSFLLPKRPGRMQVSESLPLPLTDVI